jgi:hypothetical protein
MRRYRTITIGSAASALALVAVAASTERAMLVPHGRQGEDRSQQELSFAPATEWVTSAHDMTVGARASSSETRDEWILRRWGG